MSDPANKTPLVVEVERLLGSANQQVLAAVNLVLGMNNLHTRMAALHMKLEEEIRNSAGRTEFDTILAEIDAFRAQIINNSSSDQQPSGTAGGEMQSPVL